MRVELRQNVFPVYLRWCWQQQKREIDYIWERAKLLGWRLSEASSLCKQSRFLCSRQNKRGVHSLGCTLSFSSSLSFLFFNFFFVCVRQRYKMEAVLGQLFLTVVVSTVSYKRESILETLTRFGARQRMKKNKLCWRRRQWTSVHHWLTPITVIMIIKCICRSASIEIFQQCERTLAAAICKSIWSPVL